MKITKRQLRKIIREEKSVVEQAWRENPAKIRRQRRIKDRQRMIDQMTFKQLKSRAFDSAHFINNRLRTGQYEYADIWEAEIPGLADTIDAAKVKAAEEGVTYDDIPEVIHNGGILDLSKYSLGGLEENTIKITEGQLRRIIRKTINEVRPHNRGTEGYEMTAQAGVDKKMHDAIIDMLPMRGAQGMSGSELVDSVNQIHPEIDAEMIYDFLDELLEDGVVNFDVEMDEWTLVT